MLFTFGSEDGTCDSSIPGRRQPHQRGFGLLAAIIVIVRTLANGARQRIPIDYDSILSGQSPEQDIVILAGDAVRVP